MDLKRDYYLNLYVSFETKSTKTPFLLLGLWRRSKCNLRSYNPSHSALAQYYHSFGFLHQKCKAGIECYIRYTKLQAGQYWECRQFHHHRHMIPQRTYVVILRNVRFREQLLNQRNKNHQAVHSLKRNHLVDVFGCLVSMQSPELRLQFCKCRYYSTRADPKYRDLE